MDQELKELMREEGISKSEPALWIKSETEMVHGRLILTANHLIFLKNNLRLNGSGEASDDKMERTLEVSIELDTINEISQKCHLVDKNILCVVYMQYETARFSVSNYGEWEKAIETERMNPNVTPGRQVPYKDH